VSAQAAYLKTSSDFTSQLPVDALQSFVSSLLEKLPQDSTPQVIVVKPEMPAPSPIRTNGQRAKPMSLTYDPSIVFILEFITILVARDAETIKAMGEDVADALQTVVRDAAHVHPVTLARTVYYLLSFLRASHVSLSSLHPFDTNTNRSTTSSVHLWSFTPSPNSMQT